MKTVAEYTKIRFKNPMVPAYGDVISVVLSDAKNIAIADGKREVSNNDLLVAARKYLIDLYETCLSISVATGHHGALGPSVPDELKSKIAVAYHVFFPDVKTPDETNKLVESYMASNGLSYEIKNLNQIKNAFALDETLDWVAFRLWTSANLAIPEKKDKKKKE